MNAICGAMNNQLSERAGTVGVVLINWNGGEDTLPCIESLLAGTVKPERIVVVDNASGDGSPELIARKFPEIDLVRNSENLGFTGANNIGIRRLMAAGYRYIWILNNDTVVERTCLEVLKDHMETHPEVAACSGKILFADPPQILWYAGATYNRWTIRSRHRGYGERDTGQYEDIEDVPFISGCCMFVRREAIDRLGVFDDRFFAYGEDTDWSLRTQQVKIRMAYVPRAVIYHRVSATVNKVKDRRTHGSTSPFSVYITSRNIVFLIRKHSESWLQTCTAALVHALWLVYYGTALLLLLRIEKFKALVMSLYDGMTQSLDLAGNVREKPRYLR